MFRSLTFRSVRDRSKRCWRQKKFTAFFIRSHFVSNHERCLDAIEWVLKCIAAPPRHFISETFVKSLLKDAIKTIVMSMNPSTRDEVLRNRAQHDMSARLRKRHSSITIYGLMQATSSTLVVTVAAAVASSRKINHFAWLRFVSIRNLMTDDQKITYICPNDTSKNATHVIKDLF